MANKAISELPQAQNVNNQDLFVLEQSGIAKKLTAETFITEQGIIDALAEALDGHGGIQSVTLQSLSGRIRTYLITFTDGSATTFQVLDGTSITSIQKTSTAGLVDTYTVFLNDGSAGGFFQVRNGQDGSATWDQINSKAPVITDTASGVIANFPDGADDIPVADLVVNIEPVQSGSGDPSPDNIRPISGWTGCNVTRTRKNLLPQMVDGTYTGNGVTAVVANGIATLSGTTTASGNALIIPLSATFTVPSITTYIHLGNSAVNGSVAPSFELSTDAANTSVSASFSPANRIFEIPSAKQGVAWDRIRFYLGSGVTLSGTFAPMVCYGSTATSYEPYQGTTLTIDWTTGAGTVYGGSLDVTTGVLTVTHGLVDLGTLTWSYASSGQGRVQSNGLVSSIKPASAQSVVGNIVCDTYKTVSANAVYSGTVGIAVNDNGYLWVHDSNYTDGATFKTAISGHYLAYEVATPVTYQLTPQEVKTLLGTNNIFSDCSSVNVEYRADTEIYLEKDKLRQDNNLAYVESSSSASRAYAVDELFVNRDGLLCKVTSAVLSGGTLIEGTNYTVLSGNGGLGAEVTSALNGKEDVGWLTGMGFSRTDVSGGGNVNIKDYTIFLTKLITVSGANIQSLVNAHYKVTFYLRNSNGGSFSLSGNCAGNTYNLSADSSGLVSGTYEGDVSANGTIYNGLVGGSVGSGSIFAATVLVKF